MSSSSSQEQNFPTTVIYNKLFSSSSESSEEIPSVPSSENVKVLLYQQGLYDPGSGEICTKYVPMSDSTVTRHPYYNYPGVIDPGIKEALLNPEPRKIYSLDGQELYLDLCEEMKVSPVRSFLRGLLAEAIDLKYYGVNPNTVRVMSMALTYNSYVRRLDLTSNFLNEDACYHLGQMLRENMVLQELVLSGCRIQAEGLRRLVMFLNARPLELLDLSRNDIGDEGFEHLAAQLVKGAVIKRLSLSYNELSSGAASAFSSAIEGNKTTTHLDLSWNKMSALKGINELLGQLSDSAVLVELNLSWNGLKISKILKKLILVPTLQILDLSNNRLGKFAATMIAKSLEDAKSLRILDLSYNPLTAEGAIILVDQLRNNSVKLTNLLMDNVEVNKEFVRIRKEVLQLQFRKKCNITYGFVKHDYTLSVQDIRVILLKRLDFLTSRASPKYQVDIALVYLFSTSFTLYPGCNRILSPQFKRYGVFKVNALTLLPVYFIQKKKICDNVQPREILRELRMAGTPVDESLVTALTDIFPGPKMEKSGKTLDLTGVVEMVERLWPDRKPPPAYLASQKSMVKRKMSKKHMKK